MTIAFCLIAQSPRSLCRSAAPDRPDTDCRGSRRHSSHRRACSVGDSVHTTSGVFTLPRTTNGQCISFSPDEVANGAVAADEEVLTARDSVRLQRAADDEQQPLLDHVDDRSVDGEIAGDDERPLQLERSLHAQRSQLAQATRAYERRSTRGSADVEHREPGDREQHVVEAAACLVPRVEQELPCRRTHELAGGQPRIEADRA